MPRDRAAPAGEGNGSHSGRTGRVTGSGADPNAGGEPTAILIRTPNWLGDLLMSTSFIRAVLYRFPAVPVELVVRAGFETLPLPRRGTILPFGKAGSSAGAFGRRLRGRGYSHLFVLPPSFSSAWMAFRSRIPHRIGYRGNGRAWLLRPALTHRHPPRSVHLAEEYLALLAPWIEADTAAFPPVLPVEPDWVERHLPAGLTALPPYVVLAPGAEYGAAKQWPADYYRETAQALHRAGYPVVVAGLAGERPLGEIILAGLTGACNLAGETDLNGLVALLSRCALLISNDSGAMHLGAALGCPQIALFGSTNPDWTAPLNSRAELLYRGEPCSPCYRRDCPLAHLRCLREIRPDSVTARALALLSEGGGRP